MELLKEEHRYLTEQIVTYLGNKRSLLPFIGDAVQIVRKSLVKEKLRCFDVFSGSGIVSRFLKPYSSQLIANDLESYSRVLNTCYLSNRTAVDMAQLEHFHAWLSEHLREHLHGGFIRQLYAPADDRRIQPGERVFYTVRNAMAIDTCRQAIGQLPESWRPFFLGPLLVEASVHVNTSGVFKGFYKNRDGIGHFGGQAENALNRICGEIQLPMPVFSSFDCVSDVLQLDAQAAAEQVGEVDLAYVDPPYNQHPYGSNYFMLNLITDYRQPADISSVAGIPRQWNRSSYNVRLEALAALRRLLETLKATYVLISYNSEGFISYSAMMALLKELGSVSTMSTQYNAFRGSRNLHGRDIHVREFLFLLRKK